MTYKEVIARIQLNEEHMQDIIKVVGAVRGLKSPDHLCIAGAKLTDTRYAVQTLVKEYESIFAEQKILLEGEVPRNERRAIECNS